MLSPVICVSKKLTATQQRWSTIKRELFAVVWAIIKLRYYLIGRPFSIRVDHKPLVAVLEGANSRVMEGWVDLIMEFDFTISYIPGPSNDLADAISRSCTSLPVHTPAVIALKTVDVIPNTVDVAHIGTTIRSTLAPPEFSFFFLQTAL